MKTIIVPTDYSRAARQAFINALEVARLTKAEIVLFHAFYQPITVANPTYIEDAVSAMEKEKTAMLQEYAAKIKADMEKNFTLSYFSTLDPSGDLSYASVLTASGFHEVEPGKEQAEKAALKVKCVSKLGWAADQILLAIATHQADVVVMSTRGAGGVSRALLGSTASQVIQSSPVPVLALPPMAPFKGVQSLVFACDLTQAPNPAHLEALRQWLKLFNARLAVLHLYKNNDPQEEQTKAREALAALDRQLFDVSYQVHFQWCDDLAAGIREFVQAHQADLLVLVPKSHTFLEKLFHPSVTGKIIAKAFIPVLALPDVARSLPVAAQRKTMKQKK
jgi:nucleotide-binding universal stress UspA family protein